MYFGCRFHIDNTPEKLFLMAEKLIIGVFKSKRYGSISSAIIDY